MFNYYDEIKEKLLKNEIYAKVRDYSKERNKVLTYFEVGKLLSEAGKEYGNDIIGSYADKLVNEVGKKYNCRTLRRIRQFYNIFSDTKWSPMVTKLTWSHYILLLPLKNEIYAKVKDYSKERNKVLTYLEVGKLLSKAGKEYGNDIIGKYAEKLTNEVGKKYNRRTLFRMKQFYNLFGEQNIEQKVSTMSTLLTWSHYSELLPLNDINKINYYIKICKERNLDVRSLRSLIKSKEYERLSDETKNKLITNEELKLPDLVPNPILIKTENNQENLSEYALKQAILNNLDNFLKQLGNVFSYIVQN